MFQIIEKFDKMPVYSFEGPSKKFIDALYLMDDENTKTEDIISYIIKNRSITKEVSKERNSTLLHFAITFRPDDCKLFEFLIYFDKSMIIKQNDSGDTALHMLTDGHCGIKNEIDLIRVIKAYVKAEPNVLYITSYAGSGDYDIPLFSAVNFGRGVEVIKLLLVPKNCLPSGLNRICDFRTRRAEVKKLIIDTYFKDKSTIKSSSIDDGWVLL
mgnify:CR=1 FL=1